MVERLRNLQPQALGVLAALVAMVLFLSIATPHFRTAENIFSVFRNFSFVAILAIGETLVIISAGIDLSVGSILGLSGCLAALAMRTGWPDVAAVAAGLLCGTLLGLTNGLLVTAVKLPPFIVTLGTLSIARGLAYVVTRGWPISGFSDGFMWLGQGSLWLVPVPVVVMFGFAGLVSFLLRHTVWGRQLYAIGGNEEAARLSGVHVSRVKVIAYALSGFSAALTGLLLMARLGVSQSVAGQGYELDAIAASVIGGTSLMGGQGTVSGVIIGAAVMGVLRNGLVLLGVSAFWQQVALGAVIILAVAMDRLRS
ncbi:MAG: ABC transporter permease [candidate division KSB1 bacterium]|nr:ABC transporter permease [candidate division KSB1 bacterium]